MVGAGISKQSDPSLFPSWSELLQRLIDTAFSAGYVDASDVKEMELLLARNRYLMLAEAIKSKTPTDFYYGFLEEQFNPADAKPADVHRILFKLNPRFIVTTNYDHLIEDAYAEIAHKSMSVLDYSDAGAIQRRLQDADHADRPFLFKMHGSISDVENLVLSENDYRRLRYDERGYTTVLSSIFIHYVVLFVGFSFGDEELALCLGGIRHALKRGAHPDYIFLPVNSVNSIEVERFRQDFGLEVITYEPDNQHTGVPSFLQELSNLNIAGENNNNVNN